MSRIYRGIRPRGPYGLTVVVTFVNAKNGVEILPLRLDLYNHSPAGFEWGYGGSGPAQLALAILAHATHSDEYALAQHGYFKSQVIQPLRLDSWELAQDAVLQWVEDNPVEGITPTFSFAKENTDGAG